jgi:hypothetical protein
MTGPPQPPLLRYPTRPATPSPRWEAPRILGENFSLITRGREPAENRLVVIGPLCCLLSLRTTKWVVRLHGFDSSTLQESHCESQLAIIFAGDPAWRWIPSGGNFRDSR